jgi:hypothetical protein
MERGEEEEVGRGSFRREKWTRHLEIRWTLPCMILAMPSNTSADVWRARLEHHGDIQQPLRTPQNGSRFPTMPSDMHTRLTVLRPFPGPEPLPGKRRDGARTRRGDHANHHGTMGYGRRAQHLYPPDAPLDLATGESRPPNSRGSRDMNGRRSARTLQGVQTGCRWASAQRPSIRPRSSGTY